MSKVIRTVRIGRPVVTLGEMERELQEEKPGQGVEILDLEGLVDGRVGDVRRELEEGWKARLEAEQKRLQEEADARLKAAEERWRQEREKVHAERYQEGLQAGLDQRQAEAREAVERMAVLHQSLVEERAQVLKEAELLVVDLSAALARRVTGLRAEADPRVLLRVARSALEHLSEHGNLEIKVHPDDLGIARKFAAHWVEKVDRDAVIKVRSSEHVSRGGCLIEGVEENVDARLDEQFNTLRDALREAVFGEAGDADPEESAEEADDAG